MVLQVLQGSVAEEGKAVGIVVAAIDATHPESAIGGFQQDGAQVLNLSLPDLDLDPPTPEVSQLLQAPHLR